MSIFSQILDKLGLGKRKDQAAVTGTKDVRSPDPASTTSKPVANSGSVPIAKPTGTAPTSEKGVNATQGSAVTPAAPKAMSQVDVMHMLEQNAKGTGLNWKQSISDLLFLLGIDNSREARTELAKELGAPADVMSDSARMNTWLHKIVMRKIAENGGNIPQELLD